MALQTMILLAVLSLFGGAQAADGGGGSPTIPVPSYDGGGGSPTHP